MVTVCFQIEGRKRDSSDCATWEFDADVAAIPHIGDTLLATCDGASSEFFVVDNVTWCLGDEGDQSQVIVSAMDKFSRM